MNGLLRASVLAAAAIAALGFPASGTALAVTPISWKVPVAMYHIVTPLPPDTGLTSLFVRTSEFDAQLRAAAARGVRTITAHDLAASVRANVPIPPKVMVLTFDDGRAESLTYAWPIMERYGTSLVFANGAWGPRDLNGDGLPDPGFIGTFYVIVGRSGPRYLTADQEAVLAEGGNEIANHSMSHIDVRAYHGSRLSYQLVTAGHRLEAGLASRGVATTVTTFCYPYGDTSAEAVALLRASAYTMAFTTAPGIAHSGQNVLLLPRVRVDRGESARRFLLAMGF